LTAPKAGGHTSIKFAISALLFFESLLRDAIAQRREADASAYGFAIMIEPIQDLAWALIRRSWEFSASAALHADPTVQSATRVEYSDRVSELARFGINWLAPMPLGSDRQPDTVRFKVQHTNPRKPEKDCRSGRKCGPYTAPRTGTNSAGELQHGAGSQPPDWNSTGKGIFYR
jgi:hypothetical protein